MQSSAQISHKSSPFVLYSFFDDMGNYFKTYRPLYMLPSHNWRNI
jgi:hypothetical protein